MYIDFLTLVVPLLIFITLAMQVVATRRVRKDISFAPEQRSAQLWLIWLLPVVGAALVLATMYEEPSSYQSKRSQTDSKYQG